MATTEFDEIRPYNDEELPQIFEELIADPAFQKAATDAIPNVPFELLAQKIRACKSKLDFQETFCYGILWKNSCGPYGWADSGSYGFTG